MTETRPAIAATVSKTAAKTIHNSAIGGPAWRPNDTAPWPKDRRGINMMHLARINFAEAPPLAGYPASGILQVFISTEDITFGAHEAHGRGFQIEFWPDPNDGVAGPQPFLDEDYFESSPLCEGTFEDNMHENGRALTFAACEMAKDDAPETRPEVWIGGWPYSVQDMEDRREEVVLLQVGNGEVGDDCCEFMFGGDIGTATFVVPPKDLVARKFDDADYASAGY